MFLKAKQISDSTKCIQRIYNSWNNVSLSQNYTQNEKLIMKYYLIKFSKIQVEICNLENIDLSNTSSKAAMSLGYVIDESESNESKNELNGSFEIPLPAINIIEEYEDSSRNASKSSKMCSIEK